MINKAYDAAFRKMTIFHSCAGKPVSANEELESIKKLKVYCTFNNYPLTKFLSHVSWQLLMTEDVAFFPIWKNYRFYTKFIEKGYVKNTAIFQQEF